MLGFSEACSAVVRFLASWTVPAWGVSLVVVSKQDSNVLLNGRTMPTRLKALPRLDRGFALQELLDAGFRDDHGGSRGPPDIGTPCDRMAYTAP